MGWTLYLAALIVLWLVARGALTGAHAVAWLLLSAATLGFLFCALVFTYSP